MPTNDDHSSDQRLTHTPSPVPQERLIQVVLPLIRATNLRYEKFREIEARPAVVGETITTITADGKETTNSASADAMVVRNLTEARESYIVPGDKFADRYARVESVDDTWSRYRPLGEILAIDISLPLTDRLGVSKEFQIMAPWGSAQRARQGDLFVSPLPDLAEVYRISRKEFFETYRIRGDD